MLTDRQNKFYLHITSLAFDNVNVPLAERRYFLNAKKSIDQGNSFIKIIHELCVAFENLESNTSMDYKKYILSTKTKKLLEDIELVYGKSVNDRPKDWKDSDPD